VVAGADRRPAVVALAVGVLAFALVLLVEPEVVTATSTRALLSAGAAALVFVGFVALAFRFIRSTWLLAAVVGVPLLVAAGGFAVTNLVDEGADDEVAEQLVTQLEEQAPAPAGQPEEGPADDPADAAEAAGPVRLASGGFVGLDNHSASGQASLVELPEGGRVVLFEDFEVSPGPDFLVYLVPGADSFDYQSGVELGALQGNVGAQQYAVPDGFDTDVPFTVLVWCRAFDVNIAGASPA
jgi:hypothetical protein